MKDSQQAAHAIRVLSAVRRGSSVPVIVETDQGVFFTKLRGAAQGTAALVAEVVVAELAEALGLRVPARTLVRFDGDVPSDDRHEELMDLLRMSRGINLGFQALDKLTDFRPEYADRIDPDTAAAIVWLDGLTMNPDRTARNPNLVFTNEKVWLIDHGAALCFHYDWPGVTEGTPRREVTSAARHVLWDRAGRLAEHDEYFASLLDRETIRAAVASVPDDFLLPLLPLPATAEALARRREAYVAFLWKRLKPPRPFVIDAEERD